LRALFSPRPVKVLVMESTDLEMERS
jgi:hypothetical protein